MNALTCQLCVDDGREKRDLIAAHKAELLKKQREAEEAAAAATEVAEAAAARKVNKGTTQERVHSLQALQLTPSHNITHRLSEKPR